MILGMYRRQRHGPPQQHRRSGQHGLPQLQGLTLIELMIALAISAFLLLGAIRLYTEALATYRTQALIVQLHQNARFALAAIEPDVRMAGHFGLTANPWQIEGRAGPADSPGPVAPTRDCGPNWSVDIARPVAAANRDWRWTCPARGAYADGSDTLAVRRVETTAVTGSLDPDRLYVRTDRSGQGALFTGPTPPVTGATTTAGTLESAIHELRVVGYYVSLNSVLDSAGQPVPSLRRKVLRGLRIVDEEVMPGVEDMQIQLGIDLDGLQDPGRGVVDRFVDPGAPILNTALRDSVARILSVRIWLRLRSDVPDRGHTDRRRYRYADRDFRPAGTARYYRRTVVSKTIYLRNSVGRL